VSEIQSPPCPYFDAFRFGLTLLTFKFSVLDTELIAGNLSCRWFDLPNLVEFRLSGGRISGNLSACPNFCTPLGNQNLTLLALGQHELYGPLPDISGCTQLQAFTVGQNQFTGTIPSVYWTHPTLWRFNVDNNALTGDFPQQLVYNNSIIWLDLTNNKFTGSLHPTLHNPNFYALYEL